MQKLEEIADGLEYLASRRQNLAFRRAILTVAQTLRNKNLNQEEYETLPELETIEEELKVVSYKEEELLKNRTKLVLSTSQQLDDLTDRKGGTYTVPCTPQSFHYVDPPSSFPDDLTDRKGGTYTVPCTPRSFHYVDPPSSFPDDLTTRKGGIYTVPCTPQSFHYVDPPSSFPAPPVVLEASSLSRKPSRIQCPECQDIITTDTVHRVGSMTYMVCYMSILFGCVAGCCLIPFCVDCFKDVEHKCPRCQTHIHTTKIL